MNGVSFSRDIRPLFSDTDIDHMRNVGVLLDDYAYMSDPANAEEVYEQVSSGRMPPPDFGGPWPSERVELFRSWIEGGYQP